MTFRVGQKVSCIKREPWEEVCWETAPVFGGIYTIRAIDPFPEGANLRFEEIVNRPSAYEEGVFECSFAIEHFRPILKRETDISFAHEILREVSRKETVRA